MMRWADIIRRSARSLRQAKARTLLTAAALAVGGFTLTLTLAAANGAKAYGNRLISTNFDPSSLIVTKSQNLFSANGSSNSPQPYSSSLTSIGVRGTLVAELNSADLKKLAKIPGVASVFESYQTNAQYITRAGAQKYTGSIAAFDTTISRDYVAGGVKHDVPNGGVVLPQAYLTLLHFKNAQAALGQTITVSLRQTLGGISLRQYKVAAVLASPSTLISGDVNTTLLVNSEEAKTVFDYVNQGTINYDRFLTATARVVNGNNQTQLNKVQQVVKRAGYGAESAKNAQALITQIVNVLQIIIIVFGLITLIASFFGVVNTQYISVLERTREIGLMKALGMSSRVVNRLFILEAGWIGCLGSLIGSGLAIVLGTLLNPWITKQIDFGNNNLLIFNGYEIAGLIVFLVLIAMVAGLLPARKAAKLDPIEALRTE